MKHLLLSLIFAAFPIIASAEYWQDDTACVQIDIPDGWLRLEPTNPRHKVSASSADGSLRLIVGFSSLDTRIPTNEILDRIQKQVLENFQSELIREEDVLVNGLSGRLIKHSYSNEGYGMISAQMIVVGRQKGYMVDFTGIERDPELSSEFEGIFKSFQIISPLNDRVSIPYGSPERFADLFTLLLTILGICLAIIIFQRKIGRKNTN